MSDDTFILTDFSNLYINNLGVIMAAEGLQKYEQDPVNGGCVMATKSTGSGFWFSETHVYGRNSRCFDFPERNFRYIRIIGRNLALNNSTLRMVVESGVSEPYCESGGKYDEYVIKTWKTDSNSGLDIGEIDLTKWKNVNTHSVTAIGLNSLSPFGIDFHIYAITFNSFEFHPGYSSALLPTTTLVPFSGYSILPQKQTSIIEATGPTLKLATPITDYLIYIGIAVSVMLAFAFAGLALILRKQRINSRRKEIFHLEQMRIQSGQNIRYVSNPSSPSITTSGQAPNFIQNHLDSLMNPERRSHSDFTSISKQSQGGKSLSSSATYNHTIIVDQGSLLVNLPPTLRRNLETEFVIDDFIGHGRMTTVRSASVTNRGQIKERMVAIKFLKDEDDEKAIAELRLELALILSLNHHPNIIKILGYTENPFTVVMKLFKMSLIEYLDHVKTTTQNIPEYLRKLDPGLQAIDPTLLQDLQNLNLIIAQKYKILLDIAEAISYVHKSGIVLLNLQPKNIFLEISGDSAVIASIGDFSNAKLVGSEEHTFFERIDKSNLDQFFDGGSVRYASPECLYNHISSRFCLEINRKSDLYSYSIIAYELTFSTLVWKDQTMTDVWNLVLEGNRPEITKDMEDEASRTILKPFIHLVTWCWNTDPAARPSSYEAVQFLNRPVVS